MNTGKPNGQLMTGAVGSFMNAGAWALFLTVGAAILAVAVGGGAGASEGGARAMGGLALIAVLLMLAGGICGGIGFIGLGKLHGGMLKMAGTFGILSSSFMVLAVLGGLGQIAILAQIAGYGIVISLGLYALLGGLGLLAAAGAAGAASAGGILLAIAGGLLLAIWLLGLLGVNLGSFGAILVYALFGTQLAGHLVAGITMLGQRG